MGDDGGPDGEVALLTPMLMAYHTDNSSLCDGGPNFTKNNNTPSLRTARNIALSLHAEGVWKQSSGTILSATSLEWSTPLGWLKRSREAAMELSEEAATVSKRFGLI